MDTVVSTLGILSQELQNSAWSQLDCDEQKAPLPTLNVCLPCPTNRPVKGASHLFRRP